MDRIDRLRRFLEKNEIFLKATNLLILGILGAIISYSTYLVQKQQRDIVEHKMFPVIRVKNILLYNAKEQYYCDDIIEIINEGYIIKHLEANSFCFIEIKAITVPRKRIEVILPLAGYYSTHFRTQSMDGLLMRLAGNDNNRKITEAMFRVLDITRDNNIIMLINLKKYLKIQYFDYRGERHDEYYVVDSIYGGSKLDLSEGERLWSEYNSAKKNNSSIDFNSLSPENLVKTIIGQMGKIKE